MPPAKITPELVKRMGDLFRLGMSQQQVARFHGIAPQTLRKWIYAGRKAKKGIYRDLVLEMWHGEAAAVKDCLVNLHKAHVDGNKWQAAAWYLERKHQEEWANRGPGLAELDKLYAQMVRNSGQSVASRTGKTASETDSVEPAG